MLGLSNQLLPSWADLPLGSAGHTAITQGSGQQGPHPPLIRKPLQTELRKRFKAQPAQSSGAAKGRRPRPELQPQAMLSQEHQGEKTHVAALGVGLSPSARPVAQSPLPRRRPVSPPCRAAGQAEGVSEGCCEAAAVSACCRVLPSPACLARLFPPSAEPSTFICVFPSLIRSTLPLSSNERAELKQTQSVRGGPGRGGWGMAEAPWGACSAPMQDQGSFGSQHCPSCHPLPHTCLHQSPHPSRGRRPGCRGVS